MSKLNIPDTLKVGPLSSVEAMEIDSQKLEPVTKSSTFTRWVIPNVGILDGDSMIQFSVHNTDSAGDNLCYLPTTVGAHAAIKTAVLKIGSKVVARSDDHGYWAFCDRMFRDQETRERLDIVSQGSGDVYEPSQNGDGTYQIRCATYIGTDCTPNTAYAVQTSSRTNCPIYGLKISDIFLWMKSRQLPLFAFNEEVVIEVTWQTQTTGQEGNLLIFEQTYGGGKGAEVGTEHQLFISDHLIYDDARMSEIVAAMNKEGGLTIPYEEIVLIKSQTAAVSPNPGAGVVSDQQLSTQLALSGKNVRSIFVHDKRTDANDKFNGIYGSYSPAVPWSENFSINDKQYFQRDLVSETRKLVELSKARGRAPNTLPVIYSLDPVTDKSDITRASLQSVMSSDTFFGHAQTGLQGTGHVQALDLSLTDLNISGAGTLIGSKPIEHKRTLKRTATDNPPVDTRYFCIVEKFFNLKSGMVQVSA